MWDGLFSKCYKDGKGNIDENMDGVNKAFSPPVAESKEGEVYDIQKFVMATTQKLYWNFE